MPIARAPTDDTNTLILQRLDELEKKIDELASGGGVVSTNPSSRLSILKTDDLLTNPTEGTTVAAPKVAKEPKRRKSLFAFSDEGEPLDIPEAAAEAPAEEPPEPERAMSRWGSVRGISKLSRGSTTSLSSPTAASPSGTTSPRRNELSEHSLTERSTIKRASSTSSIKRSADEQAAQYQDALELNAKIEKGPDTSVHAKVSRFVIPQFAWYKQMIDLTIFALAITSCLITPLQIAFPDYFATAGWWAYFVAVDVLFMMELVSGFFTSYTNEFDEEIKQLKYTALNYLKSWFVLDAAASIPFSLIFPPDLDPASDLSSGEDSSQSVISNLNKTLRMLKLIKLVRLCRATRVFQDLIDTFAVFDNPLMRLPMLVVVSAYYMHLCTCIWIGMSPNSSADVYEFVSRTDVYTLTGRRVVALTLGSAYDFNDASPIDTVFLLLGLIFCNYIMCSCFTIALDFRDRGSERKQKRMRLKSLLNERRVPRSLRRQVVRHFNQFWRAEGDTDEWHRLLDSISSRLRTSLIKHNHRRLLSSPLFEEICRTSGGRMAMVISMLEKMKTLVSQPPDIIVNAGLVPAGLFILVDGECRRCHGRTDDEFEVLVKGDFFGDELLTDQAAQHSVRAKTAVTLNVLLAKQFEEFLDRFPDLSKEILHAQQKAQSLRRSGKKYRKIVKQMRKRTAAGADTSFLRLPDVYDEGGEFDILLIKAEWLIECFRNGGRLVRRQDLPDSAFYRGKVEFRAVICISYCWLSKEHPDPDGWHLSYLGRMLELFTTAYGDSAVFFDFCSLYQHPRTEEEDARFHKSLRGLKHLYAHQETWVWCMTLLPPGYTGVPYDRRGWTSFEMAVSTWITNPRKQLDISQLGDASTVLGRLDAEGLTWLDVHDVCVARRPQPRSPAMFAVLLEDRKFTNNADKPVVLELYNDVFVDVFSQVEELDFTGLGWRDVNQLTETLSYSPNAEGGESRLCPQLKLLWLFNNEVEDAEHAKRELRRVLGNDVGIFGLGDDSNADELDELTMMKQLERGVSAVAATVEEVIVEVGGGAPAEEDHRDLWAGE